MNKYRPNFREAVLLALPQPLEDTPPQQQYQRQPNRRELRHPQKPNFSFSKDGKLIWNKSKAKGCFGKSKQYITQMSADPKRFVAIEKPKTKKSRKKTVKTEE